MFVTVWISPIKVQNIYETTNFYEQNLIPNWGKQYVFIDNSDETLQKFEKTARNMHSLSRYSRQNAINKEWIDEYLNEAHSQGLQSVRAHFNVLAWGEDLEELKHLRNNVGSQLASMECVPRHNTVDCPTLIIGK